MDFSLIGSIVLNFFLVIGGLITLRKLQINFEHDREKNKAEFEAENAKRDDHWRDLMTQNNANWDDYARRQLEASEKEIKRLGRAYDNAVSEATALREVNAELDTRSRERGGRIEELLKALEKTRREMLDMTAETSKREGQLSTELTQLKRRTDDQGLSIDRLNRELSKLGEENRLLRQKNTALDAENKLLLVEKGEIEDREQKLLERIEELERKQAEIEQENVNLRRRIDELNQKWSKHEQENGNGNLYDYPALPGGSISDAGTGGTDDHDPAR